MHTNKDAGPEGPTAACWYWFTDQPGHRQRIHVVDDAGELCARFEDDGDVTLVPVRDMAGDFELTAQ